MESLFSNQVEGLIVNGAPAAPVIQDVVFERGQADITIILPSIDADGGPLTGLKNVYLFVKDSPFDGSSPGQERSAGTKVYMAEVAGIVGNTVHIYVPDCVYGKTYYFVASCDD